MNQAEVLCHSSGPWKKHKYFKKIGEGKNAVYKYARNAVDTIHDKAIDAELDQIPDKIKDKAEDIAWNVDYDARQLAQEAKWKAEDAKEAIDEKTGQAAKDRWYKAEREAQSARNVRNDTYFHNAKSEGAKSWNRIVDQSVKDKRDTAHAAKQVYSKTPLGKAESTIKKGQALIDKILNPPVKRTITDTKTGKTRTPSAPKSKADTVTLKRR